MVAESGDIMNIPDKIKIGHKEYSVKLVDHEICTGGNTCFGITDCDKQEIILDKNYSQNQVEATFIHEVIHAIDDMYLNVDLTEKQISMLSKGIYITLLENKELKC